ncbi:MAG: hypothetical protein CMK83_09150 [Pseudomonadales bacterium]|nr:hypothetical protein [Pseudomonadales bacterium]RLT91851.1 MAG: hypothetical protein D9N13_00895 [Ketobacter sp. GenoA1]RLT93923.1 MAG: hypothetical protein D9N15_19265 [Ketobacter sp.]TNC86389.1 MAG: hypothetical protein CSH49_16505 [Alcanivorax sp.]HAG94653.1 hypothetical protein [Gammaproteobacteria bacterium]
MLQCTHVSKIGKTAMNLQSEDVLDFYELEAELRKIEALASPSEAHGILCGQLSGGLTGDQVAWLKEYLPNLGVKGEPWDNTREWFCQLHKFTLEELVDNQFNFMPLLPDDQDPLDTRLGSLAEWCSGFLAGFGSAGARRPEEFTEDALTALRDIQQISQVDTEIDEEEDGEAAYFEVLEYVRMAALMIFTEFAMDRANVVPPGATIH